MKSSIIFSAVVSTLAVVYGFNENPSIASPKNMTYQAGMKIPITWKDATTGYVNIDLVNMYRNVLEQPYSIAVGVPATEGKFEWEIPADLKTAVGYQVRVWGAYQPKSMDKSGNSDLFTIFNDIPQAVNNFIVKTPSKSKPCHVGSPCEITWDFPKTVNAPNDVHVNLYQVGNPVPFATLATVGANDKKFIWDVPADSKLLESGNVFISVDGTGVPHEAPKMASNMGANSEAFKIQAALPKIEDSPEYKEKMAQEAEAEAKAHKEAEEKEKEEAEKKANEEQEEADKKAKEQEEELKKRQRMQGKNAASTAQIAVPAAVLCAMIAALPFF